VSDHSGATTQWHSGHAKIDSSTFDDGSSTDVYEISDGDRLIGKKMVRHPATGPVVKITYQLGDQSFDNPDAFMTAYLKAQAVTA
jgi:hypothetical protein